MTSPCLLILEDDDARIVRFMSAIHRIDSSMRIEVWRSAKRMIEEASVHLSAACLISLDHDLALSPGEFADPGDGLDVARFLAGYAPCCPVIIHSSNLDRSRLMRGELEVAGWLCKQVLPFGEDWIEEDWSMIVCEALDISGK